MIALLFLLTISHFCVSDFEVQFVGSPQFESDQAVLTIGEEIIINIADEDATIHFTTDGLTPPDSLSPIYFPPLILQNVVVGQRVVVTAQAHKFGSVPSQYVSQEYLIVSSSSTLSVVGWEIALIIIVILFGGMAAVFFLRRHQRKKTKRSKQLSESLLSSESGDVTDSESTRSLAAGLGLENMYINEKDVKFIKEIARGSFGVVYIGSLRGTEVAIKLLAMETDHYGSSGWDDSVIQDMRQLLSQEATVWNKLRHPNICLLMGVCLQPQKCPMFLVTEYCANGSLYDIIRNFGVNFEWQIRHKLALGAAKGLKYLHEFETPILHRDMKSANILVDDQCVAKISDFGLSRVIPNIDIEVKGDILATGRAGTAAWMAPEILVTGKQRAIYSVKSDVYGFGVVLWEIASRQQPFFVGASVFEIAANVQGGGRPKISNNVNWPMGWEALVRRCWAQLPADRPTMAEVVSLLETIGKEQSCRWAKSSDGVHL